MDHEQVIQARAVLRSEYNLIATFLSHAVAQFAKML